MRTMVTVAVVLLILGSPCLAGIIRVSAQGVGDGICGMDRAGYGYPWEWAGFDSGANPMWVGHWYDSPNGSWRDAWVELSLSDVPFTGITRATLYTYLTAVNGDADIYHVSNSSTATGNASDMLGGDQFVATLGSTTGGGWQAMDVTSYVQADKAAGYDWSVFRYVHRGYQSVEFASAEGSFGTYMDVVPEPATLSLLALGGLALIRRRPMANK